MKTFIIMFDVVSRLRCARLKGSDKNSSPGTPVSGSTLDEAPFTFRSRFSSLPSSSAWKPFIAPLKLTSSLNLFI
jgi:hypothetical protein